MGASGLDVLGILTIPTELVVNSWVHFNFFTCAQTLIWSNKWKSLSLFEVVTVVEEIKSVYLLHSTMWLNGTPRCAVIHRPLSIVLIFYDNILFFECSILFRRGSPLVIGVKSKTRLSTDRFPIMFSKGMWIYRYLNHISRGIPCTLTP